MTETVPYFPSKFSMYLKKLAGFKKHTVKIYPLNRSTFKAGGDSVSFDLPAGLIDPSTFSIHMRVTATNTTQNGTVALPDNVESFFNRYSVHVGGVLVNPPVQNMSLLVNGLISLQCGDDIKLSSRSVLANGQSATLAASPVEKHLWLNQFAGILNSPHFLDTQLLNGVKIELITESANCLSSANQTCTFELSDVFAICDVIELDNEAKSIYDMAMMQKMKSGGIAIPYKMWHSISERISGSSGSVKFSVASQCLNKIVVLPQATDVRNTIAVQQGAETGNRSKFFHTTKGGIKEWYIQLAGRNSINVTADEMSFLLAQQSIGTQKDVSTGSLITSANYTSGRFIMLHSFEYVGNGDLDRSVLGLDTRFSPNGYLNLIPDGSNTNVDVNLFAECTSVLRVLAPGVVQVEA